MPLPPGEATWPAPPACSRGSSRRAACPVAQVTCGSPLLLHSPQRSDHDLLLGCYVRRAKRPTFSLAIALASQCSGRGRSPIWALASRLRRHGIGGGLLLARQLAVQD